MCSKENLTDDERREFLDEIKISVDFVHDNVLHTVAVVTRSEPMMLLTELLPRGDLLKLLRDEQPNYGGKGFSLNQMLGFCFDATCGLQYLSEQNFVHRDIAARNVLVDEEFICKISDFGLSRRMESKYYRKTTDGVLPVRWMAVECLTHGKYTIHSDIWSLAILFWEVFTYGQIPYPAMSK